jgi:N4-gp56 family major capsid protein
MAGDAVIKASGSSPNLSIDRDKFLAAKLLERSYMKLVAASVCEKVQQPKGSGLTAYFVRYKRMKVPLATLSEGVDPSDSTFSLEEVTVTLDQWGDVLTLSDVAVLTTKHPLVSIAMELLADNAARLVDREVQKVWLAGTNVLYGGGGATRASIQSGAAYRVTQDLLHKARITLANAGAPPREGPSNMKQNASGGAARGSLTGGSAYLAICGPEVIADIMSIAAPTGLWAAVAQYQNSKATYNAEVGTFLGFRFCETNFIPRFKLLGNTTAAVASGGSGGITGLTVTTLNGASGTLANSTTYHWMLVRKHRERGFAEDISIEHTTATGAADDAFTFALPSSTDYAYDLYFDTAANTGALKLHTENAIGGTTITVNAVGTGAVNPPSVGTAGAATHSVAVQPIFIHAAGSCKWVGLQQLEFMSTKDEATTHNPLKLRRMMGYKFLGKAMLPDSTRLLRVEVDSAFSVA